MRRLRRRNWECVGSSEPWRSCDSICLLPIYCIVSNCVSWSTERSIHSIVCCDLLVMLRHPFHSLPEQLPSSQIYHVGIVLELRRRASRRIFYYSYADTELQYWKTPPSAVPSIRVLHTSQPTVAYRQNRTGDRPDRPSTPDSTLQQRISSTRSSSLA